jgi:hypothetical protein
MDFLKTAGRLQKIEIAVLVVFVLFIVLPVPLPSAITPWIDSPLGVAVLLVVDAFLFFKAHPFVGVLFLLVIYELLRRASKTSHTRVPMIDYTRHDARTTTAAAIAPPAEGLSLEEELVLKSGIYQEPPRGGGETFSFQPVVDNFSHDGQQDTYFTPV